MITISKQGASRKSLKSRHYFKSKIMKIKTTVNVQKEIDIEIKIPYFCKSENERVFYKVINEDGDIISVTIYDFSTRVEFSSILYENLIFAEGNTEIEESEFNEAFEKAIETIKNK